MDVDELGMRAGLVPVAGVAHLEVVLAEVIEAGIGGPVRIVLSNIGTMGDINPLIAIALELKRRGHQPVMAVPAVYQSRILRDIQGQDAAAYAEVVARPPS